METIRIQHRLDRTNSEFGFGPFEFYGGPFSNFAPSPIHLQSPWSDGPVEYATVEHWFQACKAMSYEQHERIRLQPTPGSAKAAGRRTKMTEEWIETWDDGYSYQVMIHGVAAKFTTHPVYMKALLETGDRYIFENSPTDAVWGLWNPEKESWTGMNLLGIALMQVRDMIRGAIRDA